MDLNRKNALKLFEEQFGTKANKVKDYADRDIAKAAYNDRNSKFGWNIDHILPVSKGGSNKKNNLICCHILTNDEKADKTTFTANNKNFQVQKIKNSDGYEIVELDVLDTTSFEQQVWQHLFGDKLHVKDFAGRAINFNSNNWQCEKYISNLSDHVNNFFIAHVDTVSECRSKKGNIRTNFTANDIQFQLKKFEDNYRFVAISEIMDNDDYENIHSYMMNQLNKNQEHKEHFDILRIEFKNLDDASVLNTYVNTIKSLLNNIPQFFHMTVYLDEKMGFDGYYPLGTIELTFKTPDKNDVCKIHDFAIILNTISYYFIEKYDYSYEITIFHGLLHVKPSEILLDEFDLYDQDYKIPWYDSQHLLFVSEEVKKYLIECNYSNDDFEKTDNNSLFVHNYIKVKYKNYIDTL